MNHVRLYISLSLFLLIALVALYGRYGISLKTPGSYVAQIEPAAGEGEAYDIGGPFTLTDQDGQIVTDQDFLGSYKLLFFGFTNCPDVCPAGLQKIARTMELLGMKAQNVWPLFITVDPARDTPDVLKDYVAMYHPRLTGLTGDEAQIKIVLESYKAYASRAENAEGGHEGHYMLNHSAFIYLLDPENRVLDFFSDHDSAEDIAAALAPRISGS